MLHHYSRTIAYVSDLSCGCAAGMHAKVEPLKLLADPVIFLDTVDSSTFKQFFKWVSDSIGVGNRSIGATADLQLPPPPEEFNVII